MDVITEIIGRREDLKPGAAVDPLRLTSEQRAGGHLAAVSDGGRRVRISLPRGSELQDGDVLAHTDGLAIVVTAAEEELFRLRPGGDAATWAAACWQLGNLHRPVRFTGEGLLTPRDAMVAGFLNAIGQPYEPVVCPFGGRRVTGDQGYRHSQGHDHHHDHDLAHGEHHHHHHPHEHPHGHGGHKR